MEKWKDISSKYIALPLDHVDTDMIIPAQYLTSTSRSGYLEGLFKRLRESSPEFPTNVYPPHQRRVLVSGENFGCGSSREHAVWALTEYGFGVVIAESFADIFRANALKNGLLPVTLEKSLVKELLLSQNSDSSELKVNLEEQSIFLDGKEYAKFSIEPFRKYCLQNGVDDLEYILEHQTNIDAFTEDRKSKRFYSSL